jgi:hypothetical protein
MKQPTLTVRRASRARGLLALLCALALLPCIRANVFAQTSSTGVVSGRVLDASGAVVPGAAVELHNSATGQIQKQLSNGSGQYVFPRVMPGEYGLAVRRQGFRRSLISGVRVEVAKSYSFDVTLEVGDIAETIKVEAGAGAELQKSRVSPCSTCRHWREARSSS